MPAGREQCRIEQGRNGTPFPPGFWGYGQFSSV